MEIVAEGKSRSQECHVFSRQVVQNDWKCYGVGGGGNK